MTIILVRYGPSSLMFEADENIQYLIKQFDPWHNHSQFYHRMP